MFPRETLAIHGYGRRAVPHTFFRQPRATEHLAILLPGMGYSAGMPLLYYPTYLMWANGADVLLAQYSYRQEDGFRNLDDDEQMRWILGDATALLEAAVGQRDYGQLTLIGKSIGTVSMGHLLATEASLPNLQAIWLTPLLHVDQVRRQIQQLGGRSLVVIGTADRFFDAAAVAGIQETGHCELLTIEGADHGLNLADDVIGSVRVLQEVMQVLARFLAVRE